MDLVNEHLDELVNFIVRPPRRNYKSWELGSTLFSLDDGNLYKRIDFQVKNKRNLNIECSQYYRVKHRKKMPVVIYCHGNSGSRLDVQDNLPHLLKMEISVVAFDFSGSGNSEGEYVSLGYFEQNDLESVVEYLRKNDQTTRIGLWGRSMGAATSLMFGVSDPSVACMVLDSPFSSLKVLANELVTKNEVKIPKLVVAAAFKMLKKNIEKKAHFDIEKLEPIKSAPKCFIPALFAHAEHDDFIDSSHSKNLSAKYAGDYNIVIFPDEDQDHTSQRPSFFYDSVCIFFENNLNIKSDFGEDNPYEEDEVTAEDLASVAERGGAPKRRVYESEYDKALKLSMLESYTTSPTSQQEEDEFLQMAIKLSLGETQEAKPTTEPPKSVTPTPTSKTDKPDSKSDKKTDKTKGEDDKKKKKDKEKDKKKDSEEDKKKKKK